MSGLIIEELNVKSKNKFTEFDGMWSSSLTDSTVRGKPDSQSVDYSSRIYGLNEILDVTTKPIIFEEIQDPSCAWNRLQRVAHA